MPRFTHPTHPQTEEERLLQTAENLVRGYQVRRLGHRQQYMLRRMRINLLTGTAVRAKYYPEQVVMRTLLDRGLVLKIGQEPPHRYSQRMQEWSLTPLGEMVARLLEG